MESRERRRGGFSRLLPDEFIGDILRPGCVKRETETPLVNWNVWFSSIALCRVFSPSSRRTRADINAAGFRPLRDTVASSSSAKSLSVAASASRGFLCLYQPLINRTGSPLCFSIRNSLFRSLHPSKCLQWYCVGKGRSEAVEKL